MEVVINKGGRPKGSSDKTKRKRKKFLTAQEERYVRENWLNYSIDFFANKYEVSESCIKNIGKIFNLPFKINIFSSLKRCKNIYNLKFKCGIYAICTSDRKIYIGSSTNIYRRMLAHLNKLNKNKHQNKSLQRSWDENAWYGIIEECNEDRLIERENYYIKHTANVHNFWTHVEMSKEDIDFFKEKILEQIDIDEKGCWNYNKRIGKTGYGEINTCKDRKTRNTHRIMYYAYNPDENQNKIIRHKCNNKKCCNPDHLISGSYRDNVLDIKREEMKLFEKKFFETNCDINILLQEFKIGRSGIYSRIRKNGLREQYLEIKKIKELEFKKKRKKEKLLARIEKSRQREALKKEKEKEKEEIEKIRNLPENIMKRNREKRRKVIERQKERFGQMSAGLKNEKNV